MPRSAMRRMSRLERVLVGAHQAGGGLVEQQHARTHGERARDLDQAAIDMRQVAGRRRQRSVIADEGEQRLGGVAIARRCARPPAMLPSRPRRSAISTLSRTLMVPNSLVV